MNAQSLTIHLGDQTLSLCPEGCIHWDEARMLILSDLHLGRSAHFQRRGIPLPAGGQEATLSRLDSVLGRLRPERVVFLGDLFHSRYNAEWMAFVDWRRRWNLPFTLVRGNHDILPARAYEMADLEIVERLDCGSLGFVHDPAVDPARDPADESAPARFTPWILCGHLHPRVTIRLPGRQSARRPCFHLSGRILTLPAFGDQTGGHTIIPRKQDRTFVLTDGAVLELHPSKIPST